MTLARLGGAAKRQWARSVDRRARAVAAAILAVAFVTRLAVLVATRHLALRDDSADYQRLGSLLAHGKGFGATPFAAGGGPTALRPPVYPMFLGAVFRATGDSLTAARLLQVGFGTITVALIGLVAWQLLGRRTALVAAAIAAVYPPLVLVGNGVLTESLSLPLELGAVALALELRRRERRSVALAAVCGLLVGICILTRPANLALIVPIALLLVVRTPSRKWLTAGVVIGAMLLTLVPWQVRNQRDFHELVPITTADGFLVGGVYNQQAADDPVHRAIWRAPTAIPGEAQLFTDPSLNEADLSKALRQFGTDYARSHPSYVGVVVATNFVNLFDLGGVAHAERSSFSLGYGAHWNLLWIVSYWALALVALFGAFTRRARRVPLAVWLVPVFYVLLTVPTLGTPRYRAPIEPFIVLLAAIAVTTLVERRAASPAVAIDLDAAAPAPGDRIEEPVASGVGNGGRLA